MNRQPTAVKRGGLSGWSTREILVLVVMALAVGVINIIAYYFFGLAIVVAPLASPLFFALIPLPALFVIYVVRRPGAAILSMLLVGLVGIPFSAAGVLSIVGQVINGLFVEIPFLATRYRSFHRRMMLLAGAVFGASGIAFSYAPPLNFGALSPGVQLGLWLLGLGSGALGGLLAKLLADAVARSGVLASFALGQEQREDV